MAKSLPPLDPSEQLRVDIVSDVICPWCVIGFKQLERALIRTKTTAQIYWHPFELNPDLASDGQDLGGHVAQRCGSTPQQVAAAWQKLTELGASLGFTFNSTEAPRLVNTFRAHQLIQWAGRHGVGHQAKMALFKVFFTDAQNVNDLEVLCAIATQIGLNASEARDMLETGALGPDIREEQQFWTSNGIQGVPAMIFNRQHLVTGAQGVDTYAALLTQLPQDTLH